MWLRRRRKIRRVRVFRRRVRSSLTPVARYSPSARSRRRKPQPSPPVQTIVGCSDPRLLQSLAGALNGSPRVDVIGVATSRAEAVEKAARLRPDAVVMDIDLDGELNGIGAGLALRTDWASPGVVVVSPHNDPSSLETMPPGLGCDWSYILRDTAAEPGRLAYAVQCAAWSIPTVDPKVDRKGLGTRAYRRKAPAPVRPAGKDGWRGAVRTFSLSSID